MKWRFGLLIKREMYKKFKEKFEQIVSKKNIKHIVPTIKIDEEIAVKNINQNMIKELELLKPFGEKNSIPIFIFKNLKIDSIRSLSEGKHLKLRLKDDNILIDAIGFNLGYLSEEYLIGDKIDVVGVLEINNFSRTGNGSN